MANTFKGEMQDYEGNVIYPHTDADVVFCTDGETVQNKLNRTENVIGTITGVTDSAEAADSSLLPTAKALNQVFQSVSNGKRVIASAITDRGINTAADATFQTMAKNIGNLSRSTGNAAAAQVLAGYTFSNAAGTGITGTMTNRGAVKSTLNAGKSYTIPAGYHNGTGTVTANSLASQTAANATAAQITSGYTAWVNGVKISGVRTPSIKSENLSLNILASGNGKGIITSNAIDFTGKLFFKIVFTYVNYNRESLNIKIHNGSTIFVQQFLPKGFSEGTQQTTMSGLTAIIDISGIGTSANFQMYPENSNGTPMGTFTISSMTLYAP